MTDPSEISTSWQPAQVLQDIFAKMVSDRQARGDASPSYGVTKPLPTVSTPSDLFEGLRSARGQLQTQRGGLPVEANGTPTDDSYVQRRFDFIAGEEATRRYAYDDKTGKQVVAGIPKAGNITVGIGFNMDRPDARAVMAKAIGVGDKDFDEIYGGRKALTDLQVRKLFDYNANEAEQIVASRIKGVNLRDHQRLALVSMAFNGPSLIGPKITAAIQSGKWKDAVDEILHNSNRKNIRGLATRRWREAFMFNGSAGDQAGIPAFADYMKSFA